MFWPLNNPIDGLAGSQDSVMTLEKKRSWIDVPMPSSWWESALLTCIPVSLERFQPHLFHRNSFHEAGVDHPQYEWKCFVVKSRHELHLTLGLRVRKQRRELARKTISTSGLFRGGSWPHELDPFWNENMSHKKALRSHDLHDKYSSTESITS